MTASPRCIEQILTERIATVGKISEAAAEQLRLTCRRGGLEIEAMQDPDAAAPGLARDAAALERCAARIAALETRLAALDAELGARMKGEDG